jgi:hypothetical protein
MLLLPAFAMQRAPTRAAEAPRPADQRAVGAADWLLMLARAFGMMGFTVAGGLSWIVCQKTRAPLDFNVF